jgi:hypothetical protein
MWRNKRRIARLAFQSLGTASWAKVWERNKWFVVCQTSKEDSRSWLIQTFDC